jgi:lactoylglutathione lyase
MKFLHAMVRVSDLKESLAFYCDALGLKVFHKTEVPQGRFTLVYLTDEKSDFSIELTHNWDESGYSGARNFGHLAFEVNNIYHFCENLIAKGIDILRPPRDGYMAFIKSPDGISIELLQKGQPLPVSEVWADMPSKGSW